MTTVRSDGAAAVRHNREAWDWLARVGSSASEPWPSASPDVARSWLDEFGWLPWDELRTVLVLCGAGGQQGPAFAELGLEVTVVDSSPGQLDVDRQVATRRGLQVELVEADAQDLSALAGREFDLVYQPVSTCYLADPRACFREVARLVRAGGWYLSDHWNPVQMQLGDPPWDGTAYRLAHPLGTGEPLSIVDPSTEEGPRCDYFAHPVAELLGGICDAGFSIVRFGERGAVDPSAEPGSGPHLGGYATPFYEVLACRGEPAPSAGPSTASSVERARPRVSLGRRDTAQLERRWADQGSLVLRRAVRRAGLVDRLDEEWARQRELASETTWEEYGLSDDGTYVSGGMAFSSAPPGAELEALHRSPALLRLVRSATGDPRLVPSENVAYMYYDSGSFIDVHTDVPECELTVLTAVHGDVPPMVAYPRLRDCSPQTLLRVARRTAGRPPGGTRLEIPRGGVLLLDGRRLPHRRPLQAAGETVGIATLCFVRSPSG